MKCLLWLNFILYFMISIIVVIAQTTPTISDTCVTPHQEQGQCINLQSCSTVFQLLMKNPLTPDERTFISQSQCGYANGKPLVCCSTTITATDKPTTQPTIDNVTVSSRQNIGNCTTPDQMDGECIILQTCNSLFQILMKNPLSADDRTRLTASQCGYENGKPLVCCPINQKLPISRANLLPSPGKCGIQTENRIVGGEITRIDEFPWMALLEYSKPDDIKGFHCGGVLISDRYVLTASHCVNGKAIPRDWQLTSVRLGEWDTTTDVDCEVAENNDKDCSLPPLNILIEEKIPHSGYNPLSKTQLNDIALLRLKTKVEFTDFVKPICLPRTESLKTKNLDGFTLYVAGWGKTENESASNIKLKVGVNVVSLENCNRAYARFKRVLEPTQLCAGGLRGFDSCRGDSGGPIMTVETSSHPYWYLAGIVSFGPSPCGLEGVPGVYTKCTSYIDWIESNLKE